MSDAVKMERPATAQPPLLTPTPNPPRSGSGPGPGLGSDFATPGPASGPYHSRHAANGSFSDCCITAAPATGTSSRRRPFNSESGLSSSAKPLRSRAVAPAGSNSSSESGSSSNRDRRNQSTDNTSSGFDSITVGERDSSTASPSAEPERKKQKRNKPTLSCFECVERKTKVGLSRLSYCEVPDCAALVHLQGLGFKKQQSVACAMGQV